MLRAFYSPDSAWCGPSPARSTWPLPTSRRRIPSFPRSSSGTVRAVPSRVLGMAGSAQGPSGAYLRRDPGSGALYEVLASHLETFLARGADDGSTPGLPCYVVRELRA